MVSEPEEAAQVIHRNERHTMPAEMPTVLAITTGDVGWFGIESSSVPAVTTLEWQLRGHVAYRVSFARGVLALTLGVAMVVQPEKTSDNLATSMSVFLGAYRGRHHPLALAGQRTRGVPLVSG
jgi:hypothetical protein